MKRFSLAVSMRSFARVIPIPLFMTADAYSSRRCGMPHGTFRSSEGKKELQGFL